MRTGMLVVGAVATRASGYAERLSALADRAERPELDRLDEQIGCGAHLTVSG